MLLLGNNVGLIGCSVNKKFELKHLPLSICQSVIPKPT